MAEAKEFKPLKELGAVTLSETSEWVDEAGFKGWFKKGVRVPYKDLAAMVGYLRQMRELVAKP